MTDRVVPDEAGLEAAERLAGWELGDRGWARRIIDAYLHPAKSNERMDDEGIPKRTGSFRS